MRKVFILSLLALCLFSVSFATEEDEAARAGRIAGERTIAATASATATTAPRGQGDNVRGAPTAAQTTSTAQVAGRTAVNNRAVSGRSAVKSEQVQPRKDTAVNARDGAPSRAVASRSAIARGQVVGRQIQPILGGNAISNALRGRSASAPRSIRTTPASGRANRGRAAQVGRSGTTTGQINANSPYGKCKAAYFDCMDEFCANRDTQFRRCACSDKVKQLQDFQKDIQAAESRMKDFNENMVLVAASAEQATAAMKETEGEAAFGEGDTGSDNKKLLDNLLSKIEAPSVSQAVVFDLDANLVDDGFGVDTTGSAAKNLFGAELYDYTAASCKRIAEEDCSDDDLSIATSAYQMTIEQDCQVVEKGYNKVADAALVKVHGSSALLDEARLNTEAAKNSDSANVCKDKLWKQVRLPGICGPNLELCVDYSGQYINRANGEPILEAGVYLPCMMLDSARRAGLTDGAGKPLNCGAPLEESGFVSMMNAKRPMLNEIFATCQNDAESVWNNFLGEFVGQVKVAQSRMLDNVRQDCTKLVGACFTATAKGLENLTELALVTLALDSFYVQKAACDGVVQSCQIAMQSQLPSIEGVVVNQEMALIKQKCMAVGKECLLQDCVGIDGQNWTGCSPWKWASEDTDCAAEGNEVCMNSWNKRLSIFGHQDAGGFVCLDANRCLNMVIDCAGDDPRELANEPSWREWILQNIWGDDCIVIGVNSKCDDVNYKFGGNADEATLVTYVAENAVREDDAIFCPLYDISNDRFNNVVIIEDDELCRDDLGSGTDVQNILMQFMQKYFNDNFDRFIVTQSNGDRYLQHSVVGGGVISVTDSTMYTRLKNLAIMKSDHPDNDVKEVWNSGTVLQWKNACGEPVDGWSLCNNDNDVRLTANAELEGSFLEWLIEHKLNVKVAGGALQRPDETKTGLAAANYWGGRWGGTDYMPCVGENGKCPDMGWYTCDDAGEFISNPDPFRTCPCTKGDYCVGGELFPCPEGSYQNETGQWACLYCEPGSYQRNTGAELCDLCGNGEYCRGSGNTEPTGCGVRYYCPAPSGGVGVADPKLCDIGLCLDEGLTQGTSNSVRCTVDGLFYENGGCKACPAGSWCSNGSKTSIPGGAQNPGVDGLGVSRTGGTANKMCAASYSVMTASNLKTGWDEHCENSSDMDCVDWGTDYTSDCGTGQGNRCGIPHIVADVGKQSYAIFCSTPSPAGYCVDGNNAYFAQCPGGFYCSTQGMRCAEGSGNSAQPCNAGYKCPVGSVGQQACGNGWWQDESKRADCKPCGAGYMCPGNGPRTTRDACAVGWYQTGTTATSCNQCQSGYRCPNKDRAQEACPGGQYQPNAGQTECLTAPANSTINENRTGWYCTGDYVLNDAGTGCRLEDD